MESSSIQDCHQGILRLFDQVRSYLDRIIFDQVSVSTKSSRTDLVTNIDKEPEAKITQVLRELTPTAAVVGEESFRADQRLPLGQTFWTLDPIDGTANFVKQHCDYAILLALFDQGRPLLSYIYDSNSQSLFYALSDQGAYQNELKLAPVKDLKLADSLVAFDVKNLYSHPLFDLVLEQAFGFRFIGCSDQDGLRVIRSQYGAFINSAGYIWDFGPFYLFAQELGLSLTHIDGQDLEPTEISDFMLTTPSIAQEVRNYLAI